MWIVLINIFYMLQWSDSCFNYSHDEFWKQSKTLFGHSAAYLSKAFRIREFVLNDERWWAKYTTFLRGNQNFSYGSISQECRRFQIQYIISLSKFLGKPGFKHLPCFFINDHSMCLATMRIPAISEQYFLNHKELASQYHLCKWCFYLS